MSQQHVIMNSILKTKTMIPPHHPKTMVLKTLNHKLEKAMQYKLVLICAPAGYGKSTGVSQLMHRMDHGVAWLTLEETENEPLRFLIYLIAAVQTSHPDFGLELLNTLHSPNPPSVEWLLGCVLNQLNEMEQPLTFVFDDWHFIHAPAVQQLMDQFIAHLPGTMNLVLLTRVYPNLSFNALRLKQQMMELYTEDFILTPSESVSFFYEVMDLPHPTSHLATFERLAGKADGWVAGLQMCGLFMKDYSKNMTESIQEDTFSRVAEAPSEMGGLGEVDDVMTYQQHLATHLFFEIFIRLPAASQLCLMMASVSNRFSVALCNQLMKPFGCLIEDSFILNHLRQGHFIIALDDHHQWFRFHHLYGDFLKKRLQAWIAEGAQYKGVHYDISLKEIHATAANWFLNQGLEVEAFQLAAQGDHIDLAASILQSGELPLLYRGTVGIALEWFESLPDAAMNARPWLWIMRATAELYTGKSTSTLHYLEHATQGLAVLPPHTLPEFALLNMTISMATLRATVAVIHHDVEEIELQSTLALQLMGNQILPARCPSLWALGYAKLLKKQLPEAFKLLEEAVAMSERIGHALINIMATINIGNVYEEQNLLYEAEQSYMKILGRSDHLGYPVSCDAYLGMARICYYQNRLAESKAYLEAAQPLSDQIDKTDRKAVYYEMAARLNMAQHQPMLAFNDIEKAIRVATADQFYHRLESFYEIQCELLLMTGHLRAAQSICKDRKLSMCSIWIQSKEGRWLEAVEALERRAAVKPYCDWPKEQLKMTLLKALYYAQAGTSFSNAAPQGQSTLKHQEYEEKAYEALRMAVSMAQQGGIVRPFLACGQSVKNLSAWIEASEATVLYPEFRKLLTEALEEQDLWESQPEYEALSQRELEILGLIAEGLSNEAIAERLCLALSTVKGTNQRVFSKLQVQRRTEAVAKGKKLGLI